MTLAKNVISLPLVGGLDEKSDALVSNRPQTLTNCLSPKTGSIKKRRGYQCIGPYNKQVDGTAVPTPEHLATYGSELVRIGAGKLHTYGIVNAASDWLYRDRVPECIAEREGIVSGGGTSTSFANPTVSLAAGNTIAVYTTFDGTTYRLFADVINTSTGARAFSRYLVVNAATPLRYAKTVATGTSALVTWFDANTNTVKGVFLNLTTMTWGTIGTVGSSIATTGTYDIDVISSTEWICVAEISAGTNRIAIWSIAQTITTPPFFDVAHFTVLTGAVTDLNCSSMSVRYTAGERIWLTWGYEDPGTLDVFIRVVTFTPSMVVEAGPYTVMTSGLTYPVRSVGIERISALRSIIVWDRVDGNSYWDEVTLTLPTTLAAVWSTRTLLRSCLLSRPLVRNARAYALLANIHSTHGTTFVVDLSSNETLPTNGSPRIVATVLPRQFASISNSTTPPRSGTLSSWVSTATDTFLTASLISGSERYSFGVIGLKLLFDTTWTRTTAEMANLLAIGGGCLSGYDGSQVFELGGFAYEPDPSLVSYTNGTGGSLTVSTTYGYTFAYAWTDAQGNVHRSRSSAVHSQVMGGSDTKVTLALPCLQLTNKGATAANANVLIEVYRTAANGSTYFYVGAAVNACGTATISYVDTAADTDITSNRTVYSSGAVKQHDLPAGGPNVMAWKGGLLLHATDDDSIWISGEVLPGEGPWFNSTMNIGAFEGGRITALSLLDATPIVFKADSAFYIAGDPPNDLGVSTIGSPQKIQTDAGCDDASSIVVTPDGIGRSSHSALYMLGRNLADTWIGQNVEDSIRTAGFAGAVSLPTQGLIRWVMKGTGGADVLNLDTHHSQVYGTPVWSKDILADVQAGTSAANAVACTFYNGIMTWISSTGYLYQESSTSHADVNGAGASTWVTMSFQTAFSKPAGLGGYERVWRAVLTGLRTSPHNLTLTITSDQGSQVLAFTDASILAFTGLPNERLSVHVADQKATWMSVTIADAVPSIPSGDYSGVTIRDISLELAVKPGRSRLPATNQK